MGKPNDLRRAATAAGRHSYVGNGPEWGDSDIVDDSDDIETSGRVKDKEIILMRPMQRKLGVVETLM